MNSTRSDINRFELRTSHPGSAFAVHDICPNALSNLKHIVQDINAHIVISSDWRHDGRDYINQVFKDVGYPEIPIVGMTPYLPTLGRGGEISAWLDTTDVLVDDFVILEDYEDLGHLKDKAIYTDPNDGLDREVFKEILTYFKGKSKST